MSQEINIHISDDGMEAYLLTIDIFNSNISPEDVRIAANEAGIKYGLKKDIVEKIPFVDLEGDICIIAVGKPPTLKDDGEFFWYIDVRSPLQPKINESGRADFKMLHQFEEVKQGQELVSKIPPTMIEPGISVTGDDIQFLKITSDVPYGKNITVSDDGLSLKAEIDGYIFWKDGVIHVDNIYQIRGNVDYHTGNVIFNGTVLIGGDVKSGFRVEATDDVFIWGNVEAADVLSKNGNVVIQLGIVGKKKARILAGGSLRCGYIQDATVGVKKNVYVERYIMNSSVTSGGKIFADQNEGLIRNGRLSAGEKIIANEIGSDHGISTEVIISRGNDSGLEPIKLEISRQRLELEKRVTILKKRSEFLILLKDRLPNLSVKKRKELKSIQKEIESVHASIQVLDDNQSKHALNSNPEMNSHEIIVKKLLHRAVTVEIGRSQFVTSSRLKSVRLFKKDKEIHIESIENEAGENHDIK